MLNTWLVTIPPLIVLALAFITRNVLLSLIVGIGSAGLIVSNFRILPALTITGLRFIEQFERGNLYTFSFFLILGSLIALMNHTGGTAAYGRLVKKKLTDARLAETASLGLSFCFGIDDFFSILTVGSIMRPVTNSFQIARVKLAFLIDCLAAPLIILVPFSTWVAMVLMQLSKAGISLNTADNPLILADPFAVYLQAIPFIFYSFFIIGSVIFIVRNNISFGLMAQYEQDALVDIKQSHSTKSGEAIHGSLINFLLPLGSLVIFIVLTILYSGNYHIFGGTNTLIQAMQQADIFFALFFGSLLSLSISLIYFFATRQLAFRHLPTIGYEGYLLMKDSIIILLFAWTFSSLLKNDLHTGDYVAQKMLGSVSPLLLPVLFFITAFVTATGTGSSWGTIAVLVPLAVPMLTTFLHVTLPATIEQIPLLFPVIGAIFAGAVAGDNLSPIGTTTVMAATVTQCSIDDHVYTQLPYGIPALLITCLAYILAAFLLPHGYWFSSSISIVSGIIVTFTTLWLLNRKK